MSQSTDGALLATPGWKEWGLGPRGGVGEKGGLKLDSQGPVMVTACLSGLAFLPVPWASLFSGFKDNHLWKSCRKAHKGGIKSNLGRALAGGAQRIEHRPANHRVTGSIPSQGICLGCGPGPQ